ncbi:TIGR00341 family protein [Kordiimonas lipolytica]|uniref:TIGR00341 family protein n=1 Tax=Kordiimonas lipolytica TaxID=1662421 RepID=A0ABV8U9C6_9PROT|nr:TIGR00341 family protein [Kordiimonas lipolytica]
MPLKMLHVTVPVAAEAQIRKIASANSVISCERAAELEDDHVQYHLLTRAGERQKVIDDIQKLLGTSSRARINIMPVEATLPDVEAREAGDTREELMIKMRQGAHLDSGYTVLTLLSTIVALIGLVQDNVAVVIGAMVIAPLLGPNLAFAFGTSLGDKKLMSEAFTTAFVGMSLAVAMAAIVGVIWGELPESRELLSRTEVGLGGMALAAASGIAGVLSLTSGLSMTLVGVMVAVALLPPAATFGFMLGIKQWQLANGALLLLIVNVVCVNLSGLLVFFAKGIRPRLWFERRMATPYILSGMAVWGLLLVLLFFVIDATPS